MPKIYIFTLHKMGAEGPALAIAEDGQILSEHFCSNEAFADCDLRRDFHVSRYKKYYPSGYEIEFVPASVGMNHPGLKAAWDNAKVQTDS